MPLNLTALMKWKCVWKTLSMRNELLWIIPYLWKKLNFVAKNLPAKNITGSFDFMGKVYKTFKEGMIPILHNLFHKTEKLKNAPKLIIWSINTPIPKPGKGLQDNETYQVISFINTDAKIVNKILANWIQQYIKRPIYDKGSLSQAWKFHLKFKINQCN